MTVDELATLSGVTARTLRPADEIGLLKPARVAASGYRLYGQDEVDLLSRSSSTGSSVSRVPRSRASCMSGTSTGKRLFPSTSTA
ncbi:MAG: MerR family DNA-binding transcriptional regulator [Sphaerochaeta sp.]